MIIEIIFVLLIWFGSCLLIGVIEEYTFPKYSEDCYYCKYSKSPRTIRNKNKNTCKIINNKGWNSKQIKDCKYRMIE